MCLLDLFFPTSTKDCFVAPFSHYCEGLLRLLWESFRSGWVRPVLHKYLVEDLCFVYLAQLWEESIYLGIKGILDELNWQWEIGYY